MPADCSLPPASSHIGLPAGRAAPSLISGVQCCETDGIFVFLDLNGDRYVRLTREHSVLFRKLMNSGVDPDPAAPVSRLRERLVRANLLAPGPGLPGGLEVCSRPPPERALSDVPGPRDRLCLIRHLPVFLASTLSASQLEKTRTLSDVVAAARTWKTRAAGRARRASPSAAVLAAEFNALTPFAFTALDACRFRSLALLRYLTFFGLQADWVFGVRLSPFAAHCWIEYQGTVLTDEAGAVLEYQPIMSV